MNRCFAVWMRSSIQRSLSLFVLCWCLLLGVSQAATWTLGAEEWARPRTGPALLQMEALASVLAAFNREPQANLLIRYPGGEEGALWASELRDWLVSLGVPSTRIAIRPGQSSDDNLTLMLNEPEGE